MAGKNVYSWIRVYKTDKARMENHYRRKGVTNAAIMFKALIRGKK